MKEDLKAWIYLFIYVVCRAVHLKLVTALSTEAFSKALKRLISRKGRPRIAYCDNGSYFGVIIGMKSLSEAS